MCEKNEVQTSKQINEERNSKSMSVKKNEVQTSEQVDKERKEEIEKVTGEVMPNFTADERKCYKTLCKNIDTNLKKMEHSFFAIASALCDIQDNSLYEIDGYNNIYDFAKAKFNIGRGTCNEYIHICESFGQYDEAKEKYIDLQPEYKGYGQSKLAIMTKLSDKSLKNITPEMSVRDIKKIQQEEKNKSSSKNGQFGNRGKKIELLKISDIVNISDAERETLCEKLDKFRQENPDTEYKLSITLTY